MSALILRHNWTRQPQVPVGIDWGNPIASRNDLLAFWSGNSRYDLVSGLQITFVGQGRIEGTPVGRAIAGHNTAACGYANIDLSPYAGITLAFSFLVRPSSEVGTDDLLFEYTNNTGGGFYFDLKPYRNPTTRLEFSTKNSSNFQNLKQFNRPSDGFNHAIVSLDTTDIEHSTQICVWVNGVRQELYSILANPNTTGFADSTLFFMSRNNASLFADSRLSAFSVFGRAIREDSEARSLASNPWQLLRPMARRLWVAPAASGGTPYTLYQDMYAAISWDQATLQDALSKISTLHDLTQDAASAISSAVGNAQDATSAISSAVATTQDAQASISLVYSLTQDAFTAVSEDYLVLQDAQATISEQVGYVVRQDALAQIHETYAKVQDASAGISSEIIVVQDARAVISEGVVYSVTQDALAQISTVLLVRQDSIAKIATTVQEIHDAVAGVSSGYLVIQDGKAVVIEIDLARMAKIELPTTAILQYSSVSSVRLASLLRSTVVTNKKLSSRTKAIFINLGG